MIKCVVSINIIIIQSFLIQLNKKAKDLYYIECIFDEKQKKQLNSI